jgi:Uma2 family endonuclease
MTEVARQRHSFDDYLELEAMSPVKHEYLDGHVWAMAGGSPRHAAIAMNVGAELMAALGDRPCQVYGSDLRVRVKATGLATYPDLTVVCGALETDPEDRGGNTATNPTLLVEVLSPSTEHYDCGEKLAHYKQIPSVREVLLIAHAEQKLELWRRTQTGWVLEVAREGGQERVRLESLDCTLELARVYRDRLRE